MTIGHGQHTPRVTAKSRSHPGHTPHTPRVTVVVPVSGHWLSGHTLHTPRVTVEVPVSGHGSTRKQNLNISKSSTYKKLKKCQPEPCHGQHTPRVTAESRSWFSGHGQHTPRVTAKSWSHRSGHGQQTPRVTAKTRSRPSGHTPHTPRVTVVVPVSGQGLTRKQNKNKQNEKTENMKTNYLSHRKSLVFCSDVSLPVANKLLCSVASLPVANKLAKVSVKHPDDKWIPDVLTKTSKCQPAARATLVTGPHTPRVTVGVPDSRLARQQNKNKQNGKYENQKSNYLSNVTMVYSVKLTKLISQSQVSRDTSVMKSITRSRSVPTTGHGQHTPQVTAESRSYPGHTPHTPRVTVVVPVSGHCPTGHTLHTPRVTVVVPVSHGPGHGLHHTGVHYYFTTKSKTVRKLTARKWSIGRKLRNKLVKQCNGNGKKSIMIAHWNLGSRKWHNKINQIQAAVDLKHPDLIFISEANLYEVTPESETLISGYHIIKPLTVRVHGLSRIILLVKEDCQVKL